MPRFATNRPGPAAIIALGCWLFACGSPDPTCPTQKYPLERALQEHACTHVTGGPFETVLAAPDGTTTPLVPELRNTHVAYTVEFPAAGSPQAGVVKFKPRDTAPFIFFVDTDAVPVLAEASGEKVCTVASHPVSACPGLLRAEFYDLERKVEYRLGFGPTTPPKVLIVVEPLPLPESAP